MAEPPPAKKPTMVDAPNETQQEVSAVETTSANESRKHRLLRVPFEYPYKGGQFFYERECYATYYELVEGLLQNGSTCVTITGTPGIGKSVFYAYFAQRYISNHKNVRVIAAASSPYGLTQAAIFSEEQIAMHSTVGDDVQTMIDKATRQAMDDNKPLLQLWGGPPTMREAYGQTVVFTSPDEAWLWFADKLGDVYYMPLWTTPELHEAARVLELPIQPREIDERFRTFGGTARYCLHPDPEEVTRVETAISAAIIGVSTRKHLKQVLRGPETHPIRDHLVHYKPGDDRETMVVKSTVLASPFVEESLAARVLSWGSWDKLRTREWLRGIEWATGLHQRIFERETYDALRHCSRLQLEPLADATSAAAATRTETLTIKTSGDSHTALQETPLSDWQSLHGFFFLAGPEQNPLVLFQPTASMAPGVDAVEVVGVLHHLGWLESVAQNPERAALAFVVPREDIGTFTHQKITRINVKRDDRITAIHGIREETAKSLEEGYNIKGVNYWDLVAKIPQYVCTWEEPPEESNNVLKRTLRRLQEDNAVLKQQVSKPISTRMLKWSSESDDLSESAEL